MTTLDLTSLRNAIAQLEEAIRYCDSELARSDPKLARLFKAAAIQAFEFTYELSWKMLKRYLELTAASSPAIDELAFSDLIRTGSERGLLASGWDVWKEYRRARGITSHVYDQRKAEEVFGVALRFLPEARALLAQLHKRGGA